MSPESVARLRMGKPPQYVTSQPGQLSLIPSGGKISTSQCNDALQTGVRAGWLVPSVDVCVGGW